jgi:hypothetical protein
VTVPRVMFPVVAVRVMLALALLRPVTVRAPAAAR